MTRCFKKHLAPSYAAHACKVHRVNKFGKELFRMVLWAVSFYLLLGTRPLAVSFCIKSDKRLMKPTLSSVFFLSGMVLWTTFISHHEQNQKQNAQHERHPDERARQRETARVREREQQAPEAERRLHERDRIELCRAIGWFFGRNAQCRCRRKHGGVV